MDKDFKNFTTNEHWKTYIIYLLENNPKALKRSIIHIYKNQTPEEMVTGNTTEHNGIGFGKFDSEYLGKLALRILNGYDLSPKDEAIAKNKMKKYWKQLMVISKQKEENKNEI